MDYKSAKDILEDENFNPTSELVKLAKGLMSDYESIRKDGEVYDDNPDAKRMIALETNKLAKTNVEVIKAISDIKQKEDDLRLRLADMEQKCQERADRQKQQIGSEGEKHYFIPAYARELQSDGKYKMIKIGAANQEKEDAVDAD